MPPWTLLASAVLSLGTAAGFLAIGLLVTRRARGDEPAGAAELAFRVFWFSAAIVWGAQGAATLAGYLGVASRALVVGLDQVASPFYCLAAAMLLYYVLYLLTGRARLLVPILVYYLLAYVALRVIVESSHGVGADVGGWQVNVRWERPLQGPAYSLVVALISVPLLGAVVAYASVFFRVDDPAARYRIALVATGLLAWVGTEALSFTSGLASTTAGELARRLVALGATLLILMAYRPPAWVRARWTAQNALS